MSALRDSLLVAGLLGGCGPVANFGSGSETMASTGSGGGMTGSAESGGTGSGGGTSVGLTGMLSGSSSGAVPTTAEPTCGEVDCGTDLPLECDTFAQECPEGQKCAPISDDGGSAWNSSRCVPVLGTGMPGEPCTAQSVAEGLDSCAEGVMCWAVDMKGNGTCIAQCGGTLDAPICPKDDPCLIAPGGYLAICDPACDPLLQDCAVGAACYPIDDGFTCAPDASGEAGQVNDLCEFLNSCDAGLWCAEEALVGVGCPPGSMGCCTPYCAFPGGGCPNPDQQCVQWFDPAMLPEGDPLLDIGYCGVPK